MKTELRRTCPSCGNEFSGAMEFCPVCMLRKALAGGAESGESSFDEAVKPTREQAAQRFEHYELVTGEDGKPVELGRGAMGVTYKAFDVDLRCPVTLKVISERYLGDESARLRFLREARAAASVRHPNVAWVLHLGRTGQNYFYAMEFVEGETLEKPHQTLRPTRGKLAIEIATQVAAGLAAVHQQNLVHRDIKPTNIMVRLKEERGVTAKIIDLGLTKTLDESASEAEISSPGAFVGTPEFASPEQFGGVGVDLCGVTTSAFFALGPILAQRLGLDTRGVAVLMASGTLGGFLLAWPIGWLSDRFDRRFVIIATALTATAALFTIIALVPDEPSRWILYLCAAILGGTIVPTYSVVMAYVNDAVGEGEFVAASVGLLIVQGVGATAGPLLGGLAMSAWDHGLAYTLIAAQILRAVFGVYRSTRRAAPRQMDKGRFVVEPFVTVGTALESRTGQSGRISL